MVDTSQTDDTGIPAPEGHSEIIETDYAMGLTHELENSISLPMVSTTRASRDLSVS